MSSSLPMGTLNPNSWTHRLISAGLKSVVGDLTVSKDVPDKK